MAAPDRGVTAPAPAARPFSVWVRVTESRQDLSVSELANALRAADGELWVHIDSSVPAQVELLRSVFHFHPLAIEDTLNPMSRVKLEEYEGSYLFAIVRVLEFEERTADPYDLATTNLCFFLGQHYLVTVRNGPSPKVDAMCQQLHRNPELLGRGAERLMHAIMDSAIDAYFPILDQIDEFTHTLEERVFVTFDTGALHTIFRVKRLVLTLRRHLAPQREVFNILTNRPSVLISPEAQLYFRDIYDHVLRINDGLDTYRELLGSTLDAYLTQVSNRLALATKGLTVVATLSVPFVVVSGMWGMNFARIPLHDAPYGFWLLLGIQLLIGILLVGVLRWRRWL